MPRHGVVKQLWAYVKERELQNPNNRRQVSKRRRGCATLSESAADDCRFPQIMCDEKLQNLFGKAVVE